MKSFRCAWKERVAFKWLPAFSSPITCAKMNHLRRFEIQYTHTQNENNSKKKHRRITFVFLEKIKTERVEHLCIFIYLDLFGGCHCRAPLVVTRWKPDFGLDFDAGFLSAGLIFATRRDDAKNKKCENFKRSQPFHFRYAALALEAYAVAKKGSNSIFMFAHRHHR